MLSAMMTFDRAACLAVAGPGGGTETLRHVVTNEILATATGSETRNCLWMWGSIIVFMISVRRHDKPYRLDVLAFYVRDSRVPVLVV